MYPNFGLHWVWLIPVILIINAYINVIDFYKYLRHLMSIKIFCKCHSELKTSQEQIRDGKNS